MLPAKAVAPCEVGLFLFFFFLCADLIKRFFESGFVSALFDRGLYLIRNARKHDNILSNIQKTFACFEKQLA
jgi:hypothetical protein